MEFKKSLNKVLFFLFILIFLTGCSNNYTWGWYIINPNLDDGYNNIRFLISGFYITIFISLLSILFSQ